MIHLLIGVQGSGKSTFARKLVKEKGYVLISTDLVRQNNPGIDEKEVFPRCYQNTAKCVEENIDCIFDATSITKKVRARFFENVKKYTDKELEVIAYYFVCDKEECIRRVNIRNNDKNELYLPIEVIGKYFEMQEEPELNEGFVKIIKVVNGECYE